MNDYKADAAASRKQKLSKYSTEIPSVRAPIRSESTEAYKAATTLQRTPP